MTMERDALRVLVPMDGSPEAEGILAALMPLARARPVELTLFQVVRAADGIEEARSYLDRAAQTLASHGVVAGTRLETGEAAEEIAWYGREPDFGLIALTTHGRTGLRRALMGSVAEAVVRRARVPVLVHRPGGRVGDWKRILVPLDGSPGAEQILPEAAKLARLLNATVHVVRVRLPILPAFDYRHVPPLVPPPEDPMPYLQEVCARLSSEGVLAVPATRDGPAARGIVGAAEDLQAGVIAMTTEGRTGLERALLGSVAEEVVRTAPCPILVRRLAPVAV
jgi:nucleotide-binding universal stress UspA family protein